MNIIERAKVPTPNFFRILRNIGMALLAISGSIIIVPVVLPVIDVSIAGYAALAGGVVSVISQITADNTAKSGQKIIYRMEKAMKTYREMESNNTLSIGIASDTLLSTIPNIVSQDILKTIILGVIGAIISFIISRL